MLSPVAIWGGVGAIALALVGKVAMDGGTSTKPIKVVPREESFQLWLGPRAPPPKPKAKPKGKGKAKPKGKGKAQAPAKPAAPPENAKTAAGPSDGEGRFNCSWMDLLCEEPFACRDFNKAAFVAEITERGVAPAGHPNFKAWCLNPQYGPYAHACLVEKDLVKAAHVQYNATVAGKFGPNTADLDGSYCFIDGHCVNNAVTKDTTLDEATAMCNARFGHAWTTYVSAQSPPEDKIGWGAPPGWLGAGGFTSAQQTRPYMLAACAMGTYHCDVMICKETYCKEKSFVEKFGHFLEENKWDDGGWLRNFMNTH